jgi:hypothetical protein
MGAVMKEPEKSKVLGRLAAREAASLAGTGVEDSAEHDKEQAFVRIIRDLKVPIMQAKFVHKQLVEHLQASDLTINFYAYKFFNKKPSGVGYVSQFEGGNAWGGASYITARDQAEEAMFDYSGAKAKANVPAAVLNRIKNFGKLSEPTFEPSVRPKYAALNYARLRYGSAGQWGKSHMVLKEHVKHNATYLHTDSFDESGNKKDRDAIPGKVANFINLDRLIVNMSPAMLKALHESAQGKDFGKATQVPGVGTSAYLEAQVHGEIRFDRDIAKIVVSAEEVASAGAELQKLVAKGAPFKVVTSDKLIDTFKKFAAKNGIVVTMAL